MRDEAVAVSDRSIRSNDIKETEMNILIDINHPAHVHMFRCFAHEMIDKGHKVLFTIRDKEFEKKLMDAEKLPYINLGRKRTGKLSRFGFNLQCEYKVWRIAKRFNADLFLSHGSIVAAHVAWLLGKPAIAFEDTFNMEQVRLYLPFTSTVLTSDYDHPLKSPKVVKYPGYHELMYLHPNRFVPKSREEVSAMLGIKPTERYVVMRFVGWHATHDIGHKGFTMENKRLAIRELSKYVRVYVSSEDKLPEDIKQYKLPIKPEQISDVMAHASLIFGESSTMITEGAMLGVVGVHNSVERELINDIRFKYGLCYWFTNSTADQVAAINKAAELLAQNPKQLDEEMKQRRQRMLSEKIDVTAWLVWFVENYPESVELTRKADDAFWKKFR